LRGGTDSLPNKRNPPSAQAQNPVAVAAAIADLTIECAVEAAHVASVAARYFVEQMELGDLWAAEHSLRVAARHLREAIVQFSEWREGSPMTSLSLVCKVFTTSRLAEFCSEKELVNQTGHDSDDWPLVVLKELIDNALDACEEAGAAPVIHVAVSDAEIAVFDNGPGIAPETVAGILDL
jgi:hypothetical protein